MGFEMEATPSQDDRDQLLQRIRVLEERVHSLESSQRFVHEANNMMALSVIGTHGPDTLPRLTEFSFDGIINEFKTYTPELYCLFQKLGDTERHLSPLQSGLCVEEMKAMMSLCALFNARSQRFNGLQLLISFMLVARGTGKQVK